MVHARVRACAHTHMHAHAQAHRRKIHLKENQARYAGVKGVHHLAWPSIEDDDPTLLPYDVAYVVKSAFLPVL